MSEITPVPEDRLLKLIHHDGGLTVPVPFEREIFLFDTYIAGTTHIPGIEELEPFLNLDEKLNFFREPDNPYDSCAIVIKTAGGAKIGYVPRRHNLVFSRLMDAGKLIYGRISRKEVVDGWVKIAIRVIMQD